MASPPPMLMVKRPSNDSQYENIPQQHIISLHFLQVPESSCQPAVTYQDAQVLDAFHVSLDTASSYSSDADATEEVVTPPNSHNALIPLPIPRVLQVPRTMTSDCIIEYYHSQDADMLKRPPTPYHAKEDSMLNTRMAALEYLRRKDSNLTQATVTSSLRAEINQADLKHWSEVTRPCKGKRRRQKAAFNTAKFLFFAGFLFPPLWLIAIFQTTAYTRPQSVELQRLEWSEMIVRQNWRRRSQFAAALFFILSVLGIVLWLILCK